MPPDLQRVVRLTSFDEEASRRPTLRYWCVNAHGVEFLVVGAYALAFHGAPRFTGDLDILIRPTRDNALRLLAASLHSAFLSPI